MTVGTYSPSLASDVPEWTSCPFHRLFLFESECTKKLFQTLISAFEGTYEQGAAVLFVAVVFPACGALLLSAHLLVSTVMPGMHGRAAYAVCDQPARQDFSSRPIISRKNARKSVSGNTTRINSAGAPCPDNSCALSNYYAIILSIISHTVK